LDASLGAADDGEASEDVLEGDIGTLADDLARQTAAEGEAGAGGAMEVTTAGGVSSDDELEDDLADMFSDDEETLDPLYPRSSEGEDEEEEEEEEGEAATAATLAPTTRTSEIGALFADSDSEDDGDERDHGEGGASSTAMDGAAGGGKRTAEDAFGDGEGSEEEFEEATPSAEVATAAAGVRRGGRGRLAGLGQNGRKKLLRRGQRGGER
jgi:hypothetical protein